MSAILLMGFMITVVTVARLSLSLDAILISSLGAIINLESTYSNTLLDCPPSLSASVLRASCVIQYFQRY